MSHWREKVYLHNPKSVKLIVFEACFGQCRIVPDKNQGLKLIQEVDRFLRGPRRALGRDKVTIIGGYTILFLRGHIFFTGEGVADCS